MIFLKPYQSIGSLALLIVFLLTVNGGDNSDSKYDALVKEAKILGFEDITTANIESILDQDIQTDAVMQEKFYLLQVKVSYIKQIAKEPTLQNLLDSIALNGDSDKIRNEQLRAFRVLNATCMIVDIKVETLEKILINLKDASIAVECIMLMAKVDQEKGFSEADKFMTNNNISLRPKVRLICGMMKYQYTGGYGIMKEVLLSNNPIINSSTPLLLDYYASNNGKKITNSDKVIDINKLFADAELDVSQVKNNLEVQKKKALRQISK